MPISPGASIRGMFPTCSRLGKVFSISIDDVGEEVYTYRGDVDIASSSFRLAEPIYEHTIEIDSETEED